MPKYQGVITKVVYTTYQFEMNADSEGKLIESLRNLECDDFNNPIFEEIETSYDIQIDDIDEV